MQILVTIPDYADEGEDDEGHEERAQVLSALVGALALKFHGVSAQPLYATPLHVVAAGSPFDGMTLYGPFSTGDAAHEWAESGRATSNEGWHAVPLIKPEV